MNKLEIRQQKKNEALNKIRKIYKHPLNYDHYDECSYAEQRESAIRWIIEDLERELIDE